MSRAVTTSLSLANPSKQSGTILEKAIGPLSAGELKLKTTNPNPSVTSIYFKEPEDLKMCVQGMITVINVAISRELLKFRYINMRSRLPLNQRPRHFGTTFSLEQTLSWPYCQVGKIVDHDYKASS
ncbi:hypothetical protein H0E87_021861 [Populus deltoides]|uniref:Uncharacterized protein n=1 Tax=Populus deltoides TaxID=3696 RepID=A0A8T2XH51_POPDE|nr:hypothetical protein H0E87_021861 [Populus deltoides]